MAARRGGGRVAEWQIELGWWWQWSPLASSSYFRRREGERLHAGLAWHVGWLARYLGRLEMPVSSGVEWIGLDGTRLWVPPGQGAGRVHNKFSWACPCPSMDGWSDGRVRGYSVSFFLPANPPSTRDPTQNNFAISTANLAIASLSSAPAHSLARSPSSLHARAHLANLLPRTPTTSRLPVLLLPLNLPQLLTPTFSPPPPWAPTCEQRAAPSASARAWAQKAMTKCTD